MFWRLKDLGVVTAIEGQGYVPDELNMLLLVFSDWNFRGSVRPAIIRSVVLLRAG